MANHFESLEYESTSERPLADDAAEREATATFCVPLTQMRLWAVVIKDRAISACRDLGIPLTESAKQTACCRLFQLAHKRPITKQGLVGTVPENGLPWQSKDILPKSPSKFNPPGEKTIGK